MKYTCINIQGNLISEEILQKIEQGNADGQLPKDFGLDSGTNLRSEIEYAWSRIKLDWKHFSDRIQNLPSNAGYVQHKEEELSLPITAACSKIEKKIDIRYDGSVVMCCQDYYGIHKIGNIKTENIIDIWYGEIRQKQIMDLRKGSRKCYELCSKCSDYIVEVKE